MGLGVGIPRTRPCLRRRWHLAAVLTGEDFYFAQLTLDRNFVMQFGGVTDVGDDRVAITYYMSRETSSQMPSPLYLTTEVKCVRTITPKAFCESTYEITFQVSCPISIKTTPQSD